MIKKKTYPIWSADLTKKTKNNDNNHIYVQQELYTNFIFVWLLASDIYRKNKENIYTKGSGEGLGLVHGSPWNRRKTRKENYHWKNTLLFSQFAFLISSGVSPLMLLTKLITSVSLDGLLPFLFPWFGEIDK